MGAPQFGDPQDGLVYRDRPAAFAVVERDGLVACVRVTKPGHPAWIDLPGGAIDEGESPAEAVRREFGEETGLQVVVGEPIAAADQFFVNTNGQAFNNRAIIFEARPRGEDAALKIEEDHALLWLDPHEALRALRHDAHAWGLAAWLRRGPKG